MKRESLIASCGLYCGACEMYRADHDNNEEKCQTLLQQFNARGGKFSLDDIKCDGCLGQGKLTPWCMQCNIRLCNKRESGKFRCSSDCAEFPCSILTDFANDGMTHHVEVVDNLRQLEKTGIKKWAEMEETRWLCPQCQTPISWYTQKCSKCGAERSKKLYKAPPMF